MRTGLFYIVAGLAFLTGYFCDSLTCYGIGIFLLGIGVGGSISNSIYKQIIEAIQVINKLNKL